MFLFSKSFLENNNPLRVRSKVLKINPRYKQNVE